MQFAAAVSGFAAVPMASQFESPARDARDAAPMSKRRRIYEDEVRDISAVDLHRGAHGSDDDGDYSSEDSDLFGDVEDEGDDGVEDVKAEPHVGGPDGLHHHMVRVHTELYGNSGGDVLLPCLLNCANFIHRRLAAWVPPVCVVVPPPFRLEFTFTVFTTA